MHNQPRKADVLAHVSQNLRRLRLRAGLSQEALAAASGISRRMIIKLEGGDTNISLSSLDRLADALGASFVEIVSDPAAETRRIEALAWRGGHKDSAATLLGTAPARQETQLWHWSLGPGERYQAEADPQGWHEMIFVISGRLEVELENGPIIIEAGDFTIFSSAQIYAFRNISEEVTRFTCNVVI